MSLLKKTFIVLTAIASTMSANITWATDSTVNLNFSPIEEIGGRATSAKGPNGEAAVEVAGGEKPSSTRLIDCDAPEFSTNRYTVRGQVKYEGVVGDGYLELINDFGGKKVYFSRTLSQFGGLKKVEGTSDWREFELPFRADPGTKPVKLSLNLVLKGEGKVIVSEPRFSNLADSAAAWWTNQQGGIVGGFVGSLLGILGGLIGWSAAWGKSQRLTMGLCHAGIAIGCVCLATGAIAVVLQQPFQVYYPLMLTGIISVSVIGANLRTISQRFHADEFRRMQAIDAV